MSTKREAVEHVETIGREKRISEDTLNAIKVWIFGFGWDETQKGTSNMSHVGSYQMSDGPVDETQKGTSNMSHAKLRLKMSVASVKSVCDATGAKSQEEVKLQAVYGGEGSPNAQWSRWTPYGELSFNISNAAAFGKVLPEQFYFVDLIPTDKDAI